MLTRICLGVFGLCFLYQCNRSDKQIKPAFYYWQTKLQLSENEQVYLQKLQVSQLFIRFFDIDFNPETQEALPLASLKLPTQSLKNVEVIPVVFITNRTLRFIKTNKIEVLAKQLVRKVQKMHAHATSNPLQELQVDCDWSVETKEKYFALLKKIAQELPKTVYLSATIRLHQLKYPAMVGVPPVHKGLLMYYNMGDLVGSQTQNSILDNEIAKKYLQNYHTYTLPLDFALPLYGWGVVLRENKVVHLLNEIQTTDLEKKNFEPIAKNTFKVKKSHYFAGVYLYENDELRVENPTLNDLQQACRLLQKQINQPNTRLIFYHLSPNILRKFEVKDLEKLIITLQK
ncbi:MAG: hypothetical protein NZ551_00260 [Microscillaceae bacterium]|nr:hypothetical protein [Microscillaceae bacterium]MDW8459621.1 hypothetical protein [Cytophagales bacterium]